MKNGESGPNKKKPEHNEHKKKERWSSWKEATNQWAA